MDNRELSKTILDKIISTIIVCCFFITHFTLCTSYISYHDCCRFIYFFNVCRNKIRYHKLHNHVFIISNIHDSQPKKVNKYNKQKKNQLEWSYDSITFSTDTLAAANITAAASV